MPPTTTFPQPSTHTRIKLFKLVKEDRLLGYEIFFGSVDDIVVRNGVKRVFDTLSNMELDDELNLKSDG